MILIIVVVQDQDVNRLLSALMDNGYSATKLASTLLIGVEDEKVSEVTSIIKDICKTRKKLVSPLAPVDQTLNTYIPTPVEVEVGGATLFTIKVDSFEKM